MRIGQLIVLGWALLMAFWLLSALSAKRTASGRSAWRGAGIRVVLLLVVVWVLKSRGVPGVRWVGAHPLVSGTAPRALGLGLFVLGLALAIWARVHLGRNWGMPMSLRREHELVTSGPYARVRHPIYAGFLLACLGSALAQSVDWLVFFVLFGAYFIYSARAEERAMLRLFPDTYPQYRARTRMLIPFVL